MPEIPDLFISPHAVEQFRGRIAPMNEARARFFISEGIRHATSVKLLPDENTWRVRTRRHSHHRLCHYRREGDAGMNGQTSDQEPVLISALNQYQFCPRRCALMHIEGIWRDNEHTLAGTLLHDHADLPGYETEAGVTVLRALPLTCARYGIAGKADIVELRDGQPVPVEYKKGKRRRFDNDDVQLCAQALCLEEMFACEVPVGYIYHAASKRRREVLLDWRLRTETVRVIEAVRQMLAQGITPPAELKPRCDGCSLRGVCLPEISGGVLTPEYERCQKELWS